MSFSHAWRSTRKGTDFKKADLVDRVSESRYFSLLGLMKCLLKRFVTDKPAELTKWCSYHGNILLFNLTGYWTPVTLFSYWISWIHWILIAIDPQVTDVFKIKKSDWNRSWPMSRFFKALCHHILFENLVGDMSNLFERLDKWLHRVVGSLMHWTVIVLCVILINIVTAFFVHYKR